MTTIFFSDEPVALMDMPYLCTDNPEGRVITLRRDALDHLGLASDAGSACLEGSTGTIAIDCSAIPQANSVLLAWLIRVSHIAMPRRVTLIGVNPRQAVLFKRMRLDHLVDIRETV